MALLFPTVYAPGSIAYLRDAFIGLSEGDTSTHIESAGELLDCEKPESYSSEDEWSASGVKVRRPDRTSGRGSHNPHDVKQFKELFSDNGGEPIPVNKGNYKEIEIREHRALFYQVLNGTETVPEWVMFTKYGMACKVCM